MMSEEENAARGDHSSWIEDALNEAENMRRTKPDFPDFIGRFQILDRIGAGGMGVVYLARQSDPSRVVALKTMRTPEMSEKDRRRFQFEGELLGRLQHEGIARVYETGVLDDDSAPVPYIAMEYIEQGIPIDLFVKRAHLRVHEIAALLIRVVQAVHHAHQRGVIHRDLKPANILVDVEGRVKVVDFGLAKAEDLEWALTTHGASSSGSVMGSYAYMSPEQLEGRSSDVDARSDVYALGVIAYRLLAGKHPYVRDDSTLTSLADTVANLSIPSLGSVVRECRGDLEIIVETAMRREPDRRYASADAMGEDLSRFLGAEPIRARRPTFAYVFARFAKRHRGWVFGSILGLLALITATVWSVKEERKTKRANEISERMRLQAEKREEQAQALKGIAFQVASTLRLAEVNAQMEQQWPRRPWMLDQMNTLLAKIEDSVQARPSIESFMDKSGDQLTSEDRRQLLDFLEQPFSEFEKHHERLRARIAETEEIRETTVVEFAEAWDEVMASLEQDERFEGTSIAPQVGLIPIERNGFGLWEFYLHESGEEPADFDEHDGSILDHESGIVFVLVPPGKRTLPDERGKVREILIEPFFFAKYELTEAQWMRLCLVRGGEQPTGELDPEEGPLPLGTVSWNAASRTLPVWGLALPRINQWRHAAWAEKSRMTRYVDDCSLEELPLYGHFDAEDRAVVGQYRPNGFGLFDIAGNLCELTSSVWLEDPATYCLVGGSHLLPMENSSIHINGAIYPNVSRYDVGIRPIFSLSP